MKATTISILLFFMMLVCKGQDNIVSFGIRGGFGYANITKPVNFSGNHSYKQTVQLGVYTEIHVIKPLYLQIEMLFSNPGTRFYKIDSKGNKTGDSILSFNCLQLPVQAKIKLGGEQVKGYYMFGVATSYLLNASLKNKMDSTATNISYTPYENRLTANLMNTIGMEIDIDELVIPFIDFRYVQGLTNVYKAKSIKNETNNLQLILSVGVRF